METPRFFRASVHVITTNCMDQDIATGGEMCRLLKELPPLTETENSLPCPQQHVTGPVLSQTISVDTILNFPPHQRLGLPSGLLYLGFPTIYLRLPSPNAAACPL